MFVIEDDIGADFHQSALQVRKIHEQAQASRAYWKKRLLKELEFARTLPWGQGAHAMNKVERGLKFIAETRSVTWTAVSQCENCGEYRTSSSTDNADTRFACRLCQGFCWVTHTVGSDARARKAEEVSRVKFDADPRIGMTEKEALEFEKELKVANRDELLEMGALEWSQEKKRRREERRKARKNLGKYEYADPIEVERISKAGHAEFVRQLGCSIRRQGSHCPWCDERR